MNTREELATELCASLTRIEWLTSALVFQGYDAHEPTQKALYESLLRILTQLEALHA